MEQRNYILKTFLYMLDHKESPVVSVFWALQCDTSTKSLLLFFTVASTAERFGTSVEPKWKKKVTFENELICFETKFSLKTRRNQSFSNLDHEGARDLNIPICLDALMHKNRIYCSILLKTQFVPLLWSPDSKSQ